jgi:5-methylcytosine-specific restriction endonuclease McrA
MICPNCGIEFQQVKSFQKYCSIKCGQLFCVRRYRHSEKGLQKGRENMARYRQTENGRIKHNEQNRRYHSQERVKVLSRETYKNWLNSEEGRRIFNEAQERYDKSIKGKALHAMYSLKCRNLDANLALYKSRVIQMCEQKEPCAKCGKPFDMSFQIDHIIPLCLDGKDDYSNYQPLCPHCHKIKSSQDKHNKFANERVYISQSLT